MAIEFTWPQDKYIPEVETRWDGQMLYRDKVAGEDFRWGTINLIAEFLHGTQRIAIASMDARMEKVLA